MNIKKKNKKKMHLFAIVMLLHLVNICITEKRWQISNYAALVIIGVWRKLQTYES